MTHGLLQLDVAGRGRLVAYMSDSAARARVLKDTQSVHDLALCALADGKSLEQAALSRTGAETIDISGANPAVRVLVPIDHPDPAHLYLTGTGLTHLGSAEGRDKMHKLAAEGGAQTDSMRIFLQGLKGGKPQEGAVGVQPEWFYKGNGSSLVASGAPLPRPEFALDGSEEPEIAGVYIIDADGNPCRLGICLANEFSDHVMERENYLWLAHSKLRAAALGPELRMGPLPANIQGTSRVQRDGKTIWEKTFLTGEDNMSHSIANLEHHHFKNALFRTPGDVHVHFFGCATLSFTEGLKIAVGDVFEIEADAFALPLRNPLGNSPPQPVTIRTL
jgi:hypothetical protein